MTAAAQQTTAAAMGAIDNAHRLILLQMNTAKKAKQQSGRDWCKLWMEKEEQGELEVDECNDKSAICLV
ncbi:unnamed protein product [Vitrella brassicaformis CCMP3155]|uniref:Uncharacterized protein n=1 Tax=Vitrella brassicaformis (strain CCMP3155) TaxID=1169540 RepID=A0A0G4ELQ7_VITBC|nr:unnamed protein product [Vitrella brassicaformis CCMP3155]|eukprot:CEL98363.1 unnamed protein product [Vitrella brassicaformis CCMP3155]